MKEVLKLIVTLEGTDAKVSFSYDTDAAHALGLLELAKKYVEVRPGQPLINQTIKMPTLTPKRF